MEETQSYKEKLIDAIGIWEQQQLDLPSSDIEQLISILQSKKREIQKIEKKKQEEEDKRRAILKHQEELRKQEEHEELRKQHIIEVTSMDLPLDWENVYASDESMAGVYAESVSDGFVKCLNEKGFVDIEYISAITGEDCKNVIEKLKGSIYQNPDTWDECFYKGWETAEEYLSGCVRNKLATAESANECYNGYFSENVEALQKIMPPMVSADDIYVTLGSPWIPEYIIEEFIRHITGLNREDFMVLHDEITGTWEIDLKGKTWSNYYGHANYSFEKNYGAPKNTAWSLLIDTMNLKPATAYNAGAKPGKYVIDKENTILALDKQKRLNEDFRTWLWSDKARTSRLEQIFDERFGSNCIRKYDGSFLEFPNMNPDIKLFDYQKNAVARILFSPNTLLAHEVGSGKTYVMIAAGMELIRLGLSKKNLYVVPNNITGQWKNLFREMYPDAYIRCIEPKDFTPKKREAVFQDIRDNNYDAVIMPYSCFTAIPISVKYMLDELGEDHATVRIQLCNRRKATKGLQRKLKKIVLLTAELETEKEHEGICFEDLGFTRMFVDEAHNFKNLGVSSGLKNGINLSRTGSHKCEDMHRKVKIIQRQNGGKGVVFATGTPITNSITDAYVMQTYLQPGELTLLELQSFDSWIGMFAEAENNFEIDVDTSNFRMVTRYSKFHNIPELTNILAGIADFHQTDEKNGIPSHDGYKDVVVKKTNEFAAYLDEISKRVSNIRSGNVKRYEDNMLMITSDGRKAALDLRLVDDAACFNPDSKVFACAQNVSRIYSNTMVERSTQLVFCDTSTPKEEFNIYSELKRLLLNFGIANSEIAFIHDATSEYAREVLFEGVREGSIRVLIGSTFKLGIGVNVQDKLIALHHLDVPWRPADMVQREGRILRQGNTNDTVEIYRYITEGSFDAYSWQLLETKQRFISALLSGSVEERDGSDIDSTILNYAEVKALAIGNPLIKERVETANELTRLLILQQKEIQQHQAFEAELLKLPAQISQYQELIPLVEEDFKFFAENKEEIDADKRKELRQLIYKGTHTDELTKVDKVLTTYKRFEIIVPAKTTMSNPVVFLKRASKYMVKIGSSDVGGIVRIDNCLEGLEKRLEQLKEKLQELLNKQSAIQDGILISNDYSEEIKKCRERLSDIDNQLGVEWED